MERSITTINVTQPTFLVLSGFSGTGKTSIRNEILKIIPDSRFSISVTTRKQRPGEADNADYIFITQAEFDTMIAEKKLIEWEEVHGNRYGTPFDKANEADAKPGLVIFDVDVNGGLSVKEHFSNALLVFIKAPSYEILKDRLIKRHTDSPEEIENRLKRIPVEEEKSKLYDHIVTNENLEKTVIEICKIIEDYQSG